MYLKNDFKCPKCNKKGRIRVYQELTQDDLDLIIKNKFRNYTCSCGEVIELNYPIKFITNEYHVFYSPNREEVVDKFKLSRMTYTYDDFREKVLIFSDGLNDIVISFLKCFIHDEIESPDDLKDILFNEIKDDKIVFYLLGMNKYVNVDYSFYESILKKCKIKKSKSCILVDEGNFRDYFKM